MINHYETLGVAEDAAQDDIKSAYRKLVMKHHPDKNPGDKSSEEKFKKVQEAYDTLSEDSKRKNYDFMLKNGYDPGGFDPRNPASHYADPFSSFHRHMNQHDYDIGQDVGFNLNCSFENTICGTKKNVSFSSNEICKTCSGLGHKTGSTKKTCSQCRGSGQVAQVQNFGNGRVMQIVTSCPNCEGKGQSISKDDLCKDCDEGLVRSQVSVDIEIPAGISYGMSLRLQDKGLYTSPKGRRGHCFIKILPEKHDLFEMNQEYEIVLPLYISISDAVLGTTIKIPTIDGSSESLIIPPGTSHGDRLRIRNKGLFRKKEYRSDMIVLINIETPVNNEELEKTILKLKSMENSSMLPKTEALKKKIENYSKRR